MRVLCSFIFSNIIFVIKDNSNWLLNNRLIDIVFHFKDQADHEQAIDVRVQELSLDPLKNVRHFKRYLVNGYKFWVKVHEKDSPTTDNGAARSDLCTKCYRWKERS